MEICDGRLTGRIKGKIIDAAEKRKILAEFCKENAIPPDAVIAVGDGANDIEMARFAGLGVGFRPKPALEVVCPVVLNSTRLDALLLALQSWRA